MKRKLLIAGIVVGVIVAVVPFLGMMGATFSLFRDIGQSKISDPSALSSSIGMARFFQTLGLVACPVGLGLFFFCIVKLNALRKQPPPLPPP